MALTVRFAPRAIKDLEEIRAFLVERSPQGADRVRARIMAVIERLADLPLAGRATDDPRVRVAQLTQHPYRIFYAVETDAIVVLHIRHTSRQSLDP